MHGLSMLLIMGGIMAPLRVLAQTPTAQSSQVPDSMSEHLQAPLHPGDRIRLKIWREPDLSGDFDVDETGQAVFPKVGPMEVTGMSPGTLKRTLVGAYERWLRDPAIEVQLLRRVNIIGAVRSPGLYQIDPTMTLADAAALAGGAAADGSPDQVDLMRRGEKLPVKLSRRTQLSDTPLRSGDQLYFRQRSWLSRNTGVVAGILTATAGIIVTIATRD